MKMKNLYRQYAILKSEIDEAIFIVLNEQNFIQGSQVAYLEQQLAECVGTVYCDTCANGTDALKLALTTCGVKSGDAVFVPDFTFIATASSVYLLGATPVFVDIDKDTYNMSAESLEAAVNKVISEGKLMPKAVIAVDLFGLPADYVKISTIARKYNIKVIEDGAQGFGGSIGQQRACSFGDIAVTSFFPAKPLGCYGDGGAVFTNDKKTHELCVSLRAHGQSKEDKYDNVRCGYNSRLDTIQAAILIPKLKMFIEHELKTVNSIAVKYTKMLSDIVTVPVIPTGYSSSWAQYTIRVNNAESRQKLITYLSKKKNQTSIYYPRTLHEQGAFSDLKTVVDCKNAIDVSRRVLSIPIHPYMTEDEILYVGQAIQSFFVEGVL